MKLEFRELLRGFVGPGESGSEGHAIGRRTGGAFAFRATATIEDLAAFETDPQHRARLDGSVDWAPVGRGCPLRESEVRLFVPRPGGRALIYRLAFEAEGRRFELRGEKRLRRPPRFRELTTLHAEIFESGGQEPVARGLLRVPAAEALRFAFHVRVPGRGLAGSIGPMLRFLRFSRSQLLAPLPSPPA